MSEQPHYLQRFTYAGATETIEGAIPHLELMWDGGTMLCPVRIKPTGARDGRPTITGVGRPERDARGCLVFALPGGRKTTR